MVRILQRKFQLSEAISVAAPAGRLRKERPSGTVAAKSWGHVADGSIFEPPLVFSVRDPAQLPLGV